MATIEEAVKKICEQEPYSGGLLSEDKSVGEYYATQKFNEHSFSDTHLQRQEKYKQLIKSKVTRLFPSENVRINYGGGLILDTVDHHGLMNFPATIGSHVFGKFDSILEREKYGDYFALASGNVSLNNLAHRRGVKLSGKHINLFPKKDKNKLVSRYPLCDFNLLHSAKNSHEEFSDDELKFLAETQDMIDHLDFSGCTKLSDQVTVINYHLWEQFFDDETRPQARRCVVLEHDDILIEYLSEFLLGEQDNIVWKSLFNTGFRTLVLKEFAGIYGAWDYGGDDSGTHFFWGFTESNGKRHKLEVAGDSLVSIDGEIDPIKLEPTAIATALREGILIPSIFTKFTAVAFYMGTKLLGGISQVEYTHTLKEAWVRVLDQTDDKELELVKLVSVRNMIFAEITFYRDANGVLQRAWGFDVAYRHIFSKNYFEQLQQIPFKYTLYPFIPDYYYKVTTLENREALEYKPEDLLEGFQWIK